VEEEGGLRVGGRVGIEKRKRKKEKN